MFYTKKEKKPEVKSLSLSIKDFSKGLNFNFEENILDPSYCVNAYNFAYKKGVLTESYGFQTLLCPNYKNDTLTEAILNPLEPGPVNYTSIWFFKVFDENYGRVDKLLFYAEDLGLYFMRIITTYPIICRVYDEEYGEKPTFSYNCKLNGVDYNLFGSENMGVYKFDGTVAPVLLSQCPNLSSMCEDKGKLFGTVRGEKNKIVYHTNLDFTTWTTEINENNGTIEMNDDRGQINKVISFLGYVFAIRDYGISKISHSEGKNNFDITHLSLSGNKIYENTVQICSDKMLMLTKDGISSFNGVTSKILDLGFNEMLKGVNNDNSEGVFHSGKYYLACRLNFNDGKNIGSELIDGNKNNALIILDVQTLKYDIVRGVDIASLVSIQLNKMDKVAMIMNNREKQKVIQLNDSGAFYDEPLEKEWVSPLTDLGYSDKIKLVKNISLLSLYDCKITVFTEKEEKEFDIIGSEKLNKFKVNLRGKQIGLKINSNTSRAYISDVKLNIDLLEYGFTRN